jgi:predicted Ser/Thr protein kinase
MNDALLTRVRQALAPTYAVERELASGGMGVVFLARDLVLDRQVAVKVLRPELATALAAERFQLEARLLAKLRHPHVVPVFVASETDGLSYYVMEYIEGATLEHRLRAGPLAAPEALALANQMLDALDAVHEHGMIHRDIKPSNIFLVSSRAILTDFGIARSDKTEASTLSMPGALVGTPAYMAPEQLAMQPATERSDLYSLGMVLYEALSGRQWEPVGDPARADWTGVPGALVGPLRRALEIDPARRWPTAKRFRAAVADAARGRWRRAARFAVLGTGAGLLVWWALWPGPRPLVSERHLAVLPFEVLGAPDDSMGRLVADYTDTNLEWFPGVTRVPVRRAARWWKETGEPTGADPARAARDLHAGYVVSGRLGRKGSSLELHVSVSDGRGGTPVPPFTVPGDTAHPEELGRLAAYEIGTRVFRMRSVARTDFTNLASRNPEAAGHFAQGEALFERDAWHPASEFYARAARADSSFALARWRHVITLLWAREPFEEELRSLYACCSDRLPAHDRETIAAMLEPDLRARLARYAALARRYQGEGYVPLLYASELFHRGPLVGIGLEESVRWFEAAVNANPTATPAPAYDHLVWANIRLGNRAEARGWLRRRAALGNAAGEPPIDQFLALGYDSRWAPVRARFKLWWMGRMMAGEDFETLSRWFRFAATFDLPETLLLVGDAILARHPTATVRATAHQGQAIGLFMRGQMTDGWARLDSVAALVASPEARLQHAEWPLLLPLLGLPVTDTARVARARTTLATLAEPHGGESRMRAVWSLSLDARARGDSARARALADTLLAVSAGDSSAARLSRLLEASFLASTDPEAALAATEDLIAIDRPDPGEDVFARSLTHLERAKWFLSLDRDSLAERELLWYENSDTYRLPIGEAQKTEVDAVVSVPARLDRARLLARRGDQVAACRHVTRVRALWTNADSSMAPLIRRTDSLHAEVCR